MKVKINPYYYSKKKRFFDLIVSIILFALLLPFFFLISLIILITTGPPIFFIQKRAGKDQNAFKILKFRTMKKNASVKKDKLKTQNQAAEPMFKIHNDPRFTGLGKWLSHIGIDEIPQLINIIKGEMSLVGPRPLPVQEAEALPKNWLWRFKVKPGLLSYWTLAQNRHESLFKWMKLEEKTLIKAGIKKDFKIIIKSIRLALSSII